MESFITVLGYFTFGGIVGLIMGSILGWLINKFVPKSWLKR